MNRDLWIFAAIAVLVLAGLGSCVVLSQYIDRAIDDAWGDLGIKSEVAT